MASAKQGAETVHRGPPHRRRGAAVDVHGDGGRPVPKAFLHSIRVDDPLQRQCGVSVAEIMQRQRRQRIRSERLTRLPHP